MPRSFEPAERAIVLDNILKLTGIRLPDTLYEPVMEYVATRIEDEGVSVSAFFDRLRTDTREFDFFVDRVTIGETYFFRDERQFAALDGAIFPEFRKQGRSRLRIWSAACATGEEAVSLALLADRHRESAAFEGFTVYATDINRASLESFKSGLFKAGSLRPDGSAFHGLIEPHLSRPDALTLRLARSATDNIVPSWLDLSSLDYWSVPDDLDLIFVRNVLIYLDSRQRDLVLGAMLAKLRVNGCLFLAASEALMFNHPELELREIDGVYYLEKIPRKPPSRRAHEKKPEGATGGAFAALARAREKTSREESLRSPSPQKSAEPIAPAGSAAVSESACERCFALINAGDTVAARAIIAEERERNAPAPALLFLEGYALLHDGETSGALDFFSRCISADSGFWPARYHRAVLSAQSEPEKARRDFVKAKADIERYAESGQRDLDFLVEGFSSRYFRDMCQRWIEKLSLSGERHGNR